jgi:hypothetical protein
MTDSSFRSLAGLERTASTSRVMNLAALAMQNEDNPEHWASPLFLAKGLEGAILIKHRLRNEEMEVFSGKRRAVTKLILPFQRIDLSAGGRSVFVGQTNWLNVLEEMSGGRDHLNRDASVLEALDELPSLDPFLVREHLKRREFAVNPSYFHISPADVARMQRFVAGEINKLIQLAYGGSGGGGGGDDKNAAKLVDLLMSDTADERMEPLRLTLRLEGQSYREGIFAWKGFLYYKWTLNSVWDGLREMSLEMFKVKPVGFRDQELSDRLAQTKQRVQRGVEQQVKNVLGHLKAYDRVFEKLTSGSDPLAFREYLLSSPSMFVALGESAGILAQMASYWRFRFPKMKPLTAPLDEFVLLLQDFEANLAGDVTV